MKKTLLFLSLSTCSAAFAHGWLATPLRIDQSGQTPNGSVKLVLIPTNPKATVEELIRQTKMHLTANRGKAELEERLQADLRRLETQLANLEIESKPEQNEDGSFLNCSLM